MSYTNQEDMLAEISVNHRLSKREWREVRKRDRDVVERYVPRSDGTIDVLIGSDRIAKGVKEV